MRRRCRSRRARQRGYTTLATAREWVAEFDYTLPDGDSARAFGVAGQTYRVVVRRQQVDVSEGRERLYTEYGIERFLYRLSKSELADRFVLKGAMLFGVWAADLHRPTKDLDLLGFGEHTPDAVAAAVRKIVTTPVPDDGLRFDPASVTAEIRGEQEYGGIRAKVVGKLGNARVPLQVDVGFGDTVAPPPTVETFPTLLDQDAPRLRMYPTEGVMAEKVEAMVTLGIANSRMKDYYDLLTIFRLLDPSSEVVAEAIAATFRRRKTPLPVAVPTGLSDEFACDPVVLRRWSEFLRRLRIQDAPGDLIEVVQAVRERIWPVIQRARKLKT